MDTTPQVNTLQVSINAYGPGKKETSLPDLVKHKLMTKLISNNKVRLVEKTDSATMQIKLICRSHYAESKTKIYISLQIVEDGKIKKCMNASLYEYATPSQISSVSSRLYGYIKEIL